MPWWIPCYVLHDSLPECNRMKWLLNLVAVNSLISVVIYPMMTLGMDKPMNWLVEIGSLAAGVGALYLLIRYRKEL